MAQALGAISQPAPPSRPKKPAATPPQAGLARKVKRRGPEQASLCLPFVSCPPQLTHSHTHPPAASCFWAGGPILLLQAPRSPPQRTSGGPEGAASGRCAPNTRNLPILSLLQPSGEAETSNRPGSQVVRTEPRSSEEEPVAAAALRHSSRQRPSPPPRGVPLRGPSGGSGARPAGPASRSVPAGRARGWAAPPPGARRAGAATPPRWAASASQTGRGGGRRAAPRQSSLRRPDRPPTVPAAPVGASSARGRAMFQRQHRSRVTVARGSALEMEIRRGRFRLSLLGEPEQGTDLQKKIDHEVRMRDGACKLLAACTQRPQALEVTKSLLVCNSRILAYMAELQRMKEAQVMQHMARRPSEAGPTESRLPCRGRICVSDLRIPLMWKDTEYFKNKGDLHRCAVFCLLQIGTEIYDTEMVLADRTLADLCFENAVLFTEAGPDFELKIELYSAALEGDSALGATPKKLASRLSSSLGRSSGKQMRAALDGSAPGSNGGCSPLMLPPAASTTGPKYQLLACAHLGLAHVQDAFRTHDLLVTGNEECSFWLPLYGSLCCRLVAQPSCMVEQVMAGFLKVQGEQLDWPRLFCVLRGTNLLCYRRPQDAEAQAEAAFTIAINKETRIRASEKSPRGPVRCMSVTNHYGGEEVTHMLQAESPAEAQRWMEVFWQHFYDMSQWKHCCDEVMTVEMPSPRRPPLLLPKQGSLYHEMAIEPADDIEAVTEILARRVSDLGEPVWLSLFEGSSPGIASNSSHGCSSTGPCPPQPPWGRPRTFSLDAKLSRLKGRAGRPPPSPLPKAPGPSCSSSGSSSSCSSSPDSERTLQTPTRPWFDPRLWLQSQV